MKALRYLDLSRKRFDDPESIGAIENLTQLQTLKMNGCYGSDIETEECATKFALLGKNLQSFEFAHSRPPDTVTGAILKNMPNLTHLHLSDIQLFDMVYTGTVEQAIPSLPNLKTLQISLFYLLTLKETNQSNFLLVDTYFKRIFKKLAPQLEVHCTMAKANAYIDGDLELSKPFANHFLEIIRESASIQES